MEMDKLQHFIVTEEDLSKGKILLIDKPKGWTSFDVVAHIRSTLQKKFDRPKIKVGHGGTLDPLATGLLVIAVGPATKKLSQFQSSDKTYEGIIRLGAVTPSYDLETEPEQFAPFEHLTPEDIRGAMQQLTGPQQQLPPLYSAIRSGGERLYVKARRGEQQVERKPRQVHIYRFEANKIDLPDVYFTAHVSKGTYIRSLAHDLGQILGCGAYLAALRRTQSGDFHIDNAIDVDTWTRLNTDQAL